MTPRHIKNGPCEWQALHPVYYNRKTCLAHTQTQPRTNPSKTLLPHGRPRELLAWLHSQCRHPQPMLCNVIEMPGQAICTTQHEREGAMEGSAQHPTWRPCSVSIACARSRLTSGLKAEVLDGFDEEGCVLFRGAGVDTVPQVHDVVASPSVAKDLLRAFLFCRVKTKTSGLGLRGSNQSRVL